MEVKQGYKQTEVGVIPEDWDVKLLHALANIRSGLAKNSNTTVSDPIRVHYLRVANVQDGFLDLTDMSQIEVSRSDLNRFSVLPGDVLMNEGGDLDKLGRGSIWRGELQPCIHQNHVFVVRCGSFVSPEYLTIWSSGTKARRYFLIAGKQTTNLASINKTSLGELPVVLPTQDEQRAIATALSDMDALLDGLDRLITKKRAIKQATMQQLLTGQTRLPGFSGEWEVKRLGDLAKIQKGQLITTKTLILGDIPVIAGGKQPAYFHALANRHGKTITVSASGASAGYVALHLRSIFASDCSTISESDSYCIEFVYYSMLFRQDVIYAAQTGGAQPHVQPKDLAPLSISIPDDIAEQRAIASVLSDMDAEITVLETRRTKTHALKQAMMQELLTGRTRLVTPASEASEKVVNISAGKANAKTKAHNWQINEAVVISVLANRFGSEQYPLGRKRCTKLAYLLHRHVEHVAEGFRKKAAGPYNPDVKYRGPEGIAQKNGYIRQHRNGQFSGFVADQNITEAEAYFMNWYGQEVLDWLEQFRKKTNDELELLTTVDMSVEDLDKKGSVISLETVKALIAEHPEWKSKLERPIFSDINIKRAIQQTRELFTEQG